MNKRFLAVGVAAVAALLMFFAVPASAQYQPTSGQTLSATTVSPGQTITVSGFGCPAGSTVTTRFDTTVLGTTTASKGGDFSLQVTIPANATAGTHEITSTCGAVVLSSTITVTAASTTGGTAGTTGGTAGTTGGATTGGSTGGSAATGGGTNSGTLARTGANTSLYLEIGFALLAAGGIFLMVARTHRRNLAA